MLRTMSLKFAIGFCAILASKEKGLSKSFIGNMV